MRGGFQLFRDLYDIELNKWDDYTNVTINPYFKYEALVHAIAKRYHVIDHKMKYEVLKMSDLHKSVKKEKPQIRKNYSTSKGYMYASPKPSAEFAEL